MVRIPLLSLKFPSNAVLFYSLIIAVTNFEIINTDILSDIFFDFTETQAVNLNFELMEYET